MESLRQIGAGILLGVVSAIIVLGAFALAMAEGGLVPAVAPASPTTNSSVPIIITIFPTLTLPISATSQGAALAGTDTPGPTFTATATLTPPPTLIICPPPAGWIPIIVQPYDTLTSLSQVYRTSVELLRTKNCLLNDQLVAGSILYVPPLPTSTRVPCGAPGNWGYYTVVAGDTLYHISLLYRVTVSQLMQANCLYTSNISVGQVLRVPNVPTSTSAVTDTPSPTLTETLTLTLTPSAPATETPSPTASPSGTAIPATSTSVSTDTPTPPTPANP